MGRSMLHEIYLFKGLTESEMASLSELAETQTYNTGDTIFIKGEPARAMYFIKHGSVKIQQTTKSGDSIVVATLGTGSHFGTAIRGFNENRP